MNMTFLQHDKNETEPIRLSPVFAIFQAPHVRLYAYVRIQPDTPKPTL